MIVRVYHAYYGCETGCCGHTVEIEGHPDGKTREHFDFGGPGGEVKAWARTHAEETIREQWPECLESIDWSTLDIDDVQENC